MVSTRRKFRLIASFAVLGLMAVAVGCHGFFVDPVLTSMTVSTLQSTNLVNVGSTVQLQATGAFDDGSTKNLTGKATWSVTSNSNFVSVNSAGLATALVVSPSGTVATVQAAAQSTNGTVVSGTINITVGQSTVLTINSSLGTTISLATHTAGTAITITSSLNGTNKTASTTFTSSNSAVINISSNGQGTIGGTTGVVTITGSDSADNATGTLQITVTN
jgi:trimeric autotransporter adhesin